MSLPVTPAGLFDPRVYRLFKFPRIFGFLFTCFDHPLFVHKAESFASFTYRPFSFVLYWNGFLALVPLSLESKSDLGKKWPPTPLEFFPQLVFYAAFALTC